MKKAWKIEIFRDKAKKCRIRLLAGNGRIIMSSEAYSSKAKAEKTATEFCSFEWTNKLKLVDLT